MGEKHPPVFDTACANPPDDTTLFFHNIPLFTRPAGANFPLFSEWVVFTSGCGPSPETSLFYCNIS